MKNNILISLLFLLTTSVCFAQSYSEMMQQQKDLLSAHDQFSIDVDQKTIVAGVLDEKMSFETKIKGHNGKLFWETPELTVIHNERSYLMVRKREKVILYSTFAKPLDMKAEVNASLSNWDKALEEYVGSASSIEKIDHATTHEFVIEAKTKLGAIAKVKFEKATGLMTWMEVIQVQKTGESIVLTYEINYDFESSVSENKFDEKNLVTSGENPSGKGNYADYRVIYNPIE